MDREPDLKSRLLRYLTSSDSAFEDFEEPIRSEIFASTRMEEHAQSLARAQTVIRDPRRGRSPFARLADNARVLEKSYDAILLAVEEKRAITPAAEWLIDNFHIVRAQLHDIREHLPRRFYQELPKLADGPLRGLPRVYGIAWAYLAHTDSRFDSDMLERFLRAYQTVQPLTIGELWAVPITLRLVMMENLRRLSARIVGSQEARFEADALANELLGLGETKGLSADAIMKRLNKRSFPPAFAVQLLQRLRFQDHRAKSVVEWLDLRLIKQGLHADEIVSREHSSQTAANASVRNIITSARMISSFNWSVFVEDVSLVDHVMRRHPLFAKMDFTTRNRYRGAIEELGRHSSGTEIEVAGKVVALATENSGRQADLGYYLIGSGRRQLEAKIGFRTGVGLRLRRYYKAHATPTYLGLITALTLFILSFPIRHDLTGGAGWEWTLALAILGIFPASALALATVNRISIWLLGAHHLPRLSLEEGIPREARTFTVVPTMFSRPEHIEMQLEQLEIHHLANPDDEMFLALLTDWTDATQETRAGDQEMLAIAQRKLNQLNAKHGPSSHGYARFYVFHRRRVFNPQEGRWMGWERKRGKLSEFNKLLLGAQDTTYISLDGEPLRAPPHVRFVITLDADTRLPNGAVKQLVGSMLHPLNLPVIDPKRQIVVRGYGILQPRITPTLPSSLDSTPYQRLSTGNCGIDPYASAISDIYQDLFDEGSFTGKGIYDVAVFERVMKGRVPENALLSHDLFEGNCARTGFLSDVEFFEDFPSHTQVAAARQHRWMRGDWQLLPWIFGPRGHGLTSIGRWKMIDNLRRSLVVPTIFLLMILALVHSWQPPNLWFLLALAGLATPLIITLFEQFLRTRGGATLAQHFQTVHDDVEDSISRLCLDITLLPFHTFLAIDAITRALYRLLISHRHMLEWTTAAQSKAASSLNLKAFWREFRLPVLLTVLGMILLGANNPWHLLATSPLFLLWLASPLLARTFSRPPHLPVQRPVSALDDEYLRQTARRIWLFFTTFVTSEDHYLPPDNFQETPNPVVAHRSSPTNFGLYLLSTLAAQDFGWIGLPEMVGRLLNTLEGMRQLPRFQGHFYNWYETREARALEPRYISSVDNGNLAGHLLAVGQGCLEALDRPMDGGKFSEGAEQTWALLESSYAKMQPPLNALSEAWLELHSLKSIAKSPHDRKFRAAITRLHRIVVKTPGDSAAAREFSLWTAALRRDLICGARDEWRFWSWRKYLTELDQNFGSEIGWTHLRPQFDRVMALKELPGHWALLELDLLALENSQPKSRGLLKRLRFRMASSARAVEALISRLRDVHRECHQIFFEMDFRLLYDPKRKLFSIGYRVADEELDAGYYDLLASESRLTSFIAVGKGDVPSTHWFRLGRALTKVKSGAVLVSWSGSMFEYLMPSLVMHSARGSLIEQTCLAAVKRQIQYGQERGVPWGISESAYNKRDLQLTYQYSNFGVPDLGLKRGLGSDLVVAPYATLLAVMYQPQAAVENLHRLDSLGASGPFGFYEAVDFTASRLPEGQTSAVINAYMAHHQGMSLVAIANYIFRGRIRDRFHAEPLVQAAELLLQERTPRNVSVSEPARESFALGLVREEAEHVARRYHAVNRPVPTTQVLSNGEYSVMLTSSGSGFSRFRNLAVTRWREDVTRDNWGSYFYLRDLDSRDVWSAGYQPICREGDSYEVTFAEDRVHIRREDFGIICDLEVFLSPEDHAEVRSLTLTNNSLRPRDIELTSYAEVVLNSHLADVAHPAFSNLFVQTEFYPMAEAILATRRPRMANDEPLWLAHVLLRDRHSVGPVQYETERVRFIGRGRTVANPQALFTGEPLSNTVGSVLDPSLSLRTKIHLEPGATAHVAYSTVVANSREEILHLAEKFNDRATIERVSNLAWTQAQVKLQYLNIEPDEAHLFQRVLTRLLYSEASLRPAGEVLTRNGKDVTGLWGFGISGDFPILLARIDDFEDRGIIRQLLKAHEYYGIKGITVDLVILNDQGASYSQELQNSLEAMVQSAAVASQGTLPQARGKVFVLRGENMAIESRLLLYASARAAFSSRQGSLSEQAKRIRMTSVKRPRLATREKRSLGGPELRIPKLQFNNGLGGFSEDGREYVIVLSPDMVTPAPWINVIANESFGFQVSETGAGYTWSVNSRENQLTPWFNDPVTDPTGEAFFIRDLESGSLWTPTAGPIRIPYATYITRHGQGYSRFEHLSHGIESQLTQFVAPDLPVKISRLTLKNHSSVPRSLAICGYCEWVLGFSRATMAPQTVTRIDSATGALFATNPRSEEFGARVAFATFQTGQSAWTGDRTEFLGRNGELRAPAALVRGKFSGQTGAALDPCAALETEIHLAPGESREVVFFLGQADDAEKARALLLSLRTRKVSELLTASDKMWSTILDKVQVETPDRAMDLLLNRWLLYQTVSCRFWARAAFYQAGGAFGFRDQLQDSMALAVSMPSAARAQILKASRRQFIEGDVQHWWHPPSGRGVRTHFSDDLLWLPYVVSHFLKVTQDVTLLNEEVPFLEGPTLRPDQEDSYYTPKVSINGATIYEHCARALDKSLEVGAHGLPLIGAGDWNDGMNRIGHEGKGESVWLAWFLFTCLEQFAPFAKARGETDRAERWLAHARHLQLAAERDAWDGEWYRRAYFDDGTPVGSKTNEECRIDSLTQTWAVISAGAEPARATQAMQAVERWLIKPDDAMVLLFTPPFDHTTRDPGYIKGYLPGVRENGGQYTHAAVWCVIAFAMMGERAKAAKTFALLNPIRHGDSPAKIERYKVEPYVLAADVYSVNPFVGRGGWTWYTGSSGWMYRAGIEYILGLQVQGGELLLQPCVPEEWKEFVIRYRHGRSEYILRVINSGERPAQPVRIQLVDDGQIHEMTIRLSDQSEKVATAPVLI